MAVLRVRRLAHWILGLALLAGAALPAAAAAGHPVELQLKAAYLYKFASYVEWPDDSSNASGTFVIGVAGSDAVAAQLARVVAGRAVNGRPVEVRRVGRRAALDGLHMLYVTGPRDTVAHILDAARGHALLTVTDSEQDFAHGGVINFLVADNRLRFEVALRRAASARLRISSRMLAAAHKVDMAIPI